MCTILELKIKDAKTEDIYWDFINNLRSLSYMEDRLKEGAVFYSQTARQYECNNLKIAKEYPELSQIPRGSDIGYKISNGFLYVYKY